MLRVSQLKLRKCSLNHVLWLIGDVSVNFQLICLPLLVIFSIIMTIEVFFAFFFNIV
jgi:hypothetical protein